MSFYADQGFAIPERMGYGIEMYVKKGVIPGQFLQAIICNNLFDAVAHADAENLHNLPAYVRYFYNHAPSPCWGGKEAMKAWSKEGGTDRKKGDIIG